MARDCILRPMLPRDVPQLLPIEAAGHPFPWSEQIFQDCLKAGYSSWVLEPAGSAIAAYGLMSMGAGEGHILNISVADDLRGQGFGRRMLDHLMRLAQAAELEVLLLEVRPSNAVAIQMYEATGFRQIGRRKRYYRAAEGREDAVIYAYRWRASK